MIDIIIPTLWKSEGFLEYLEKYLNNPFINKIIIIDNDYKNRPKFNFDNKKIKIFKPTTNIFVNPAWNLGVSFSTADIVCLGSDDLWIQDDVFSFINHLNFDSTGIIGAEIVKEKKELKLKSIEVTKQTTLGRQFFGFGTCMFLLRKNYINIPSLYKIWFGDDFLVHELKNVYTIPILFDKYKMSETTKKIENRELIEKRILLDIINAQKHLKINIPKFKLNK